MTKKTATTPNKKKESIPTPEPMEEEDQVVQEYDLYLDLPSTRSYLLNWVNVHKDTDDSVHAEITKVNRKPTQHKLQLEMSGKLANIY